MERVRMPYDNFAYTLPPTASAGLQFIFHDPYEIASSAGSRFTLSDNSSLFLSITPELVQIDDSLVDEEPEE
jgi:hypothetical protein